MITGAQIRAARAMLRWSADKLAEEARLGVATIRRADAADGEPSITAANAQAIRSALEKAGIVFEDDKNEPGVKINFDSAHEELIFRHLADLFPGSQHWQKADPRSRPGCDIVGVDGAGRQVFIEVKGTHAPLAQALAQVRSLAEAHPDARLILALVGRPDFKALDEGVEIHGFPSSEPWLGPEALGKLPAPHR